MNTHLVDALRVAQLIVPEIDLDLTEKDGAIHVHTVPLSEWYYYFSAIDCISKFMIKELNDLPDVEKINTLIEMSENLDSLLVSLKIFYLTAMDEIGKDNEEEGEIVKPYNQYLRLRKRTPYEKGEDEES